MNATATTTATKPTQTRREAMQSIDAWMTAAADAVAEGYLESSRTFSALAANEIALLALRNAAGVSGWAM